MKFYQKLFLLILFILPNATNCFFPFGSAKITPEQRKTLEQDLHKNKKCLENFKYLEGTVSVLATVGTIGTALYSFACFKEGSGEADEYTKSAIGSFIVTALSLLNLKEIQDGKNETKEQIVAIEKRLRDDSAKK